MERIVRTARKLREGRRRVWAGEGRLWAEVRGGGADIDALVAHIESSEAVAWARWNGALERLVVQHHGDPDAALAASSRPCSIT